MQVDLYNGCKIAVVVKVFVNYIMETRQHRQLVDL